MTSLLPSPRISALRAEHRPLKAEQNLALLNTHSEVQAAAVSCPSPSPHLPRSCRRDMAQLKSALVKHG